MGNSNTKNNINEIIDGIYKSEKFASYQAKFQSLNPSKILYLEGEDLIVESVSDGPYTIAIYEFDWLCSGVENEIYKDLDELYESYLSSEYVENVNIENVNTENVNTENIENENSKVYDFVSDSISDGLNLNDWLNKYFHPESSGYKLFKNMKNSGNIYSLFEIWHLMFQQAVKQDYTVVSKSIVDQELISNGYEIRFGEKSIVIISEIDGKFWYVGIAPDCFDRIQNIHNKQ